MFDNNVVIVEMMTLMFDRMMSGMFAKGTKNKDERPKDATFLS